MKENLEQIKVGLLGVIAVVLIVNTFFMNGGSTDSSTPTRPSISPTTPSNAAASNITAPGDVTKTINTNDLTPPAEPAKPAGPPTKMSFGQMKHDFGSIDQNSENKHVFAFTNTGDKPLVIQSAVGSCGCTVPEYPKEPVLPGESGEIKVVYKPGTQKAKQTKTVTITANTEPSTTQLTITADVQEIEGAAAGGES